MEEREVRIGAAGAGFVGCADRGDCFAAFLSDAYAAILHDKRVEGLQAFADRLRAAQITEAVLEFAASDHWVDVPAREPMEVAP
jgi:hypothetical protein